MLLDEDLRLAEAELEAQSLSAALEAHRSLEQEPFLAYWWLAVKGMARKVDDEPVETTAGWHAALTAVAAFRKDFDRLKAWLAESGTTG